MSVQGFQVLSPILHRLGALKTKFCVVTGVRKSFYRVPKPRKIRKNSKKTLKCEHFYSYILNSPKICSQDSGTVLTFFMRGVIFLDAFWQ